VNKLDVRRFRELIDFTDKSFHNDQERLTKLTHLGIRFFVHSFFFMSICFALVVIPFFFFVFLVGCDMIAMFIVALDQARREQLSRALSKLSPDFHIFKSFREIAQLKVFFFPIKCVDPYFIFVILSFCTASFRRHFAYHRESV